MDNFGIATKRYGMIPALAIILASASVDVLGGECVASAQPNLTTAVVLRAAAPSVSPVLGNIDDVAWLAAFLVLASLIRGLGLAKHSCLIPTAGFFVTCTTTSQSLRRRSGISFHHGGLYGP